MQIKIAKIQQKKTSITQVRSHSVVACKNHK